MNDRGLIVVSGKSKSVEWAETRAGERPASEFFDGLATGDRVKVLALLKRFADTGVVTNREKFKKVADNLFEFKCFQVRLLRDHRPGHRFVLALGVKKKKNKHNRNDLDKARRILAENDMREKAQRRGRS